MLKKEILMSDYKKFVVLVFDEMKVRETLVFGKISSNIIGFIQLNDVFDQLLQIEKDDEKAKNHSLSYTTSYYGSDNFQ